MKVLLVEDNEGIGNIIKKELKTQMFVVDWVKDGKEGLDRASVFPYEVILLDLNLPTISGSEVAKLLREKGNKTPIIALTIDMDVDSKVNMLEYCDDYVTKPFSFQELFARIRAVTRRGNEIKEQNIFEVGDLILDEDRCRVTRAGKEIELRNKEFMLLRYLMKHVNSVVSRGELLENVWDMFADPFTNTVDVHIGSLRKKINKNHKKKLIRTISGRGFILESDE